MKKRDQILDVDLDYFNWTDRPVSCVKRMLKKLDRKLPAILVVEHQQVLPEIRRMIQEDRLLTPVEYFHVDEHHDFYGNPCRKFDDDPHCGDYMFYLPFNRIKFITWIRTVRSGDEDWYEAKEWSVENRIRLRVANRHVWTPNRVGIVTFAVSPDYLEDLMLEKIDEITGLITDHFRLKETVWPDPTADLNRRRSTLNWNGGLTEDRGKCYDFVYEKA